VEKTVSSTAKTTAQDEPAIGQSFTEMAQHQFSANISSSSLYAASDALPTRKRKHSALIVDEDMQRCRGDTPHMSEVFAFEGDGLEGGWDMLGQARWNWGEDIPRSVGIWGQ
jgi:hypothetical protein